MISLFQHTWEENPFDIEQQATTHYLKIFKPLSFTLEGFFSLQMLWQKKHNQKLAQSLNDFFTQDIILSK